MPTPRSMFSAVVLEGCVYCLGGESDAGVLGAAERYDPLYFMEISRKCSGALHYYYPTARASKAHRPTPTLRLAPLRRIALPLPYSTFARLGGHYGHCRRPPGGPGEVPGGAGAER